MLLVNEYSQEPTRPVLFRSAACLMLNLPYPTDDHFRQSERMVAFGLSGNPPEEIAEVAIIGIRKTGLATAPNSSPFNPAFRWTALTTTNLSRPIFSSRRPQFFPSQPLVFPPTTPIFAPRFKIRLTLPNNNQCSQS